MTTIEEGGKLCIFLDKSFNKHSPLLSISEIILIWRENILHNIESRKYLGKEDDSFFLFFNHVKFEP